MSSKTSSTIRRGGCTFHYRLPPSSTNSTSKAPPSINRLSSHNLLLIFRYLPLEDQLQLDRVCIRWAALQRIVTRSLSSLSLLLGCGDALQLRENSLFPIPGARLLNGNSKPKLQPEFSLKLSNLSLEQSTHLLLLCPSVTTLELFINKSLNFLTTSLPAILQLLEVYKLQLTVFKLHFASPSSELLPFKSFLPLFNSINSSCRLNALSIELRSTFIAPQPIDLPIIRQLTEFHFFSNYDNLVVESLKHYGLYLKNSQALQAISYGDLRCTTEKARKLGLELGPNFASRFVRLLTDELPKQFHYDTLTPIELAQFCSKFTSLTSFSLFLCNPTPNPVTPIEDSSESKQLNPLLSILSQKLDKLCYLNLRIGSENLLDPIETSISSISVLRLSLVLDSHRNLRQLKLPSLFPNLQVIFLQILNYNSDKSAGFKSEIHCTSCHSKITLSKAEIFAKSRQCARKILREVKVHPTLQTIFFHCHSIHNGVLEIPTKQADEFIAQCLM